MPPALRLKNDFDELMVRLHPFSFARLVSTGLSTASLRRPVRNAGEEHTRRASVVLLHEVNVYNSVNGAVGSIFAEKNRNEKSMQILEGSREGVLP